MVLCGTHKAISSISVYNYTGCCAVSWPKCKYRLSGVRSHYLGWTTHTHTHTHAHTLFSPPVWCYIRQSGRESGSSNRAIRTPRDPIDLIIDPLLPWPIQTTVWVHTATI
ncbi:hypothetical protein AMECASPLE_035722 [Ameca splendens]|uniref:Uncharacterized protein n=1 Tax=Ameca splendens TaxID=208324 RepID=A0ABV0XKI4_9TELE